ELSRISIRKGATTAHEFAVQALANCEARNSPPPQETDPCADERGSLRAAKEALAKVRAEDWKQRIALMGFPMPGLMMNPAEAAAKMKALQEKFQECGNIER